MDVTASRLNGPRGLSAVNPNPCRPRNDEAARRGIQDALELDQAPSVRSHGGEIGKRTFDIVFALALIVILLPLLALVAALVWLSSPGPVIYRQIRAGHNGGLFVLYKFRTMLPGADGMLLQDEQLRAEFSERWKIDQDPRVTFLGKWLRKTSIDELPQLFNVLNGEMSIVGPRPVQPDELEERYGELAGIVFSLKPGLTGLWQVSGRSSCTYEERIALDLAYAQQRSGWLDLLLVVRTIPAVLFMRDAS